MPFSTLTNSVMESLDYLTFLKYIVTCGKALAEILVSLFQTIKSY